ncbi:MAG: hypothetical protein AAGH65_07975, partial [Pseudomonadota bacterium]
CRRRSICFRADNSIGWWFDPERPVPSGAFRDAMGVSDITLGPGSEQTSTIGCGIRLDGSFVCWDDAAGSADIVFTMPGNYREMHSLRGIQLIDANGNSQAFGIRDFGNALHVAKELVANFGEQCMIDQSNRIGCKGISSIDVSPVNQTVQQFRGMDIETNLLCAISDINQIECWAVSGGSPPDFADQFYDQVVVGVGHACALSEFRNEVRCAGSNPFLAIPSEPFPEIANQYRDIATSAFAVCVIVPNGQVDCFSSGFIGTGPPNTSIAYRQIELSAFTNWACLIDQNDNLECFETFGTGQPWASFISPTGSYRDVAIAQNAICALTTGNQPVCWGIESTLAQWNEDGPEI